jgi:hypothetical protein
LQYDIGSSFWTGRVKQGKANFSVINKLITQAIKIISPHEVVINLSILNNSLFDYQIKNSDATESNIF